MHSSTTYQSLRIQLVQNAPDDGPMRSETCRANLSAEKNILIKTLCVSFWTAYILQDDIWSLQCQVCVSCWTAYILHDDTRSLQCQVNIPLLT